MATIKKALKEIEEAVSSGNSGVIGEYLADNRVRVRTAAEDALKSLEQSGIEDNTPPLETPEDAGDLSEYSEPKEVVDSEDSIGPKDEDANMPVRAQEWITMTEEEVMAYQKDGVLVGYNPKLNMGLLKKEE